MTWVSNDTATGKSQFEAVLERQGAGEKMLRSEPNEGGKLNLCVSRPYHGLIDLIDAVFLVS